MKASSSRIVLLLNLCAVVSAIGCRLITGEVFCRNDEDCPNNPDMTCGIDGYCSAPDKGAESDADACRTLRNTFGLGLQTRIVGSNGIGLNCFDSLDEALGIPPPREGDVVDIFLAESVTLDETLTVTSSTRIAARGNAEGFDVELSGKSPLVELSGSVTLEFKGLSLKPAGNVLAQSDPTNNCSSTLKLDTLDLSSGGELRTEGLKFEGTDLFPYGANLIIGQRGCTGFIQNRVENSLFRASVLKIEGVDSVTDVLDVGFEELDAGPCTAIEAEGRLRLRKTRFELDTACVNVKMALTSSESLNLGTLRADDAGDNAFASSDVMLELTNGQDNSNVSVNVDVEAYGNTWGGQSAPDCESLALTNVSVLYGPGDGDMCQ